MDQNKKRELNPVTFLSWVFASIFMFWAITTTIDGVNTAYTACRSQPEIVQQLERIAKAEEEQAFHLKEIARWCWTDPDEESKRRRVE